MMKGALIFLNVEALFHDQMQLRRHLNMEETGLFIIPTTALRASVGDFFFPQSLNSSASL